MIYLIGGAPRVGKSILGHSLAQEIGARLLSTDDLCDIVSDQLSDEEKQLRFPNPSFSGNPQENTLTPKERIQRQYISAQSLEAALERIINDSLHKHETLIIEGILVLPKYAAKLIKAHGSDVIRSLFVGWKDAEAITHGILHDQRPENWLRESDEQVIRQVADFIAAFSQETEQECSEHHLPYQERTDDFMNDLKTWKTQLTSR